MTSVGVAIPSIPPRGKLLLRCVQSVLAQTHPVAQIHVEVDVDHSGAGPTRSRAIAAMHTEWTCLIDDDDEMYPSHVQRLIEHARETGADVVYPWFDVRGGTDPFPQFEGKEWDPEAPRIFPITVLARTELLQMSEFPEPKQGAWMEDDWPFWQQIQDAGGKIVHLPERTWAWHHHSFPGNTSGVPTRW